jgi:hypothetical protein
MNARKRRMRKQMADGKKATTEGTANVIVAEDIDVDDGYEDVDEFNFFNIEVERGEASYDTFDEYKFHQSIHSISDEYIFNQSNKHVHP